MTNIARMWLFAAALAIGSATATVGAKAPTYILNGYSLSGIRGVNTAELAAKLRHKPGERVTEADIGIDTNILRSELKARHVEGQLVATIAEKHGRVWIIFDLLDTPPTIPRARYLEAQKFEGASRISAGELAAVTNLKPGEPFSAEKINAARRAILAMYAQKMPGKAVNLKTKLQITQDGKVRLTWIVQEPS